MPCPWRAGDTAIDRGLDLGAQRREHGGIGQALVEPRLRDAALSGDLDLLHAAGRLYGLDPDDDVSA